MFSIYIHVPFCVRKCPYCDFYSVATNNEFFTYEKYLSAVLKQIHQSPITLTLRKEQVRQEARSVMHDAGSTVHESCFVSHASDVGSSSPVTVYFGGGTPSLLSPNFFEKVLAAISNKFSFSKDAEITCEVNPGTVNKRWFEDVLNAGVNRVSIGVQSFDNRMLKSLGRIHNSEEAQLSIASAEDAGFQNISIDLMSGLPLQTVDAFVEDLKTAMTFQPQHISVYQLTFSKCHCGIFSPSILPPDDVLANMYRVTSRVLERGGWQQYEISNHSRVGHESRHNLNYWNYGEYFGLGPSAASFSYFNDVGTGRDLSLQSIFAVRSTAKPDLKQYLNGNFEYEPDNITRRQAMGEFCFLGLRKTCGIRLADFEHLFEVPLLKIFGSQILSCVSEGFLELSDENLKLTLRGRLFSNQVFAELL